MKRIIASFALSALSLAGCGDNDHDGADAFVQPPAPALGAQIDRMGRPAVNTALNNAFNPDMNVRAARKQAYNEDGNRAGWVAAYTEEFQTSLALIDALDDMCGNQAGFQGAAGDADKYAFLAGVLADDQLIVNMASGACTFYLGVEGAALMEIPPTTCGGRAPTYDVIDVSYTALVSGALGTVIAGDPAIGDGVDLDDGTASNTVFPFLGAP